MQKYEELLISLRRVIRAIDLYSKKLNRESGLTGPQLIVMQQIAANDGILARQIAESINLSPATVTSILDRLEARQLIIRQRSNQDKRRVELYLTEPGKQLVQSAPTPLQQHFIQRFESLEEWEQSQMLAAVQRIAKMMDAEELDAAPMLDVGQLQRD
ncbi:MarR family winged helix-turn-helix transcriptional regulator [Bowmanella sp. JS7-9]|uniref:MarR family winged helix-turn-helix transcriptional regulator n=1 Tax=Pseudobowmanella zhangzhouensis TaxID=1537679 RepID=A0ABW1XP68_9ALTE|nr:MarR family transcriptional regulator [Bowmanella sp. JS7-9]TBX23872.1 transcriptional regulator [Bowmanella sp. JS7-9]